MVYPLTFDPIYKQKVWGGRSLERLGRALPGDASTPIGESWELADLSSTSVSGGGGGAEHSVVANGPLAGQTIRQLMLQYGEQLLGPGVRPAPVSGFPLLIKFLDARQNLSVQVHPSPAYAAAHPDAHLKSEAWYVVAAEPGAVIYKGLAEGVTEQQLRAAITKNTDDAVLPLLNAVPVKPGDCHYLPSGTLHALGAGVLVAEVQTPSDTTFRVYDWGRTGRELHVEQAMACIDFSPPAEQAPIQSPGGLGPFAIDRKAACDYFDLDEVSCNEPTQAEHDLRTAETWVGLRGTLKVETGDRNLFELGRGMTALLPASLGRVAVQTDAGGCWLRVVLPAIDR